MAATEEQKSGSFNKHSHCVGDLSRKRARDAYDSAHDDDDDDADVDSFSGNIAVDEEADVVDSKRIRPKCSGKPYTKKYLKQVLTEMNQPQDLLDEIEEKTKNRGSAASRQVLNAVYNKALGSLGATAASLEKTTKMSSEEDVLLKIGKNVVSYFKMLNELGHSQAARNEHASTKLMMTAVAGGGLNRTKLAKAFTGTGITKRTICQAVTIRKALEDKALELSDGRDPTDNTVNDNDNDNDILGEEIAQTFSDEVEVEEVLADKDDDDEGDEEGEEEGEAGFVDDDISMHIHMSLSGMNNSISSNSNSSSNTNAISHHTGGGGGGGPHGNIPMIDTHIHNNSVGINNMGDIPGINHMMVGNLGNISIPNNHHSIMPGMGVSAHQQLSLHNMGGQIGRMDNLLGIGHMNMGGGGMGQMNLGHMGAMGPMGCNIGPMSSINNNLIMGNMGTMTHSMGMMPHSMGMMANNMGTMANNMVMNHLAISSSMSSAMGMVMGGSSLNSNNNNSDGMISNNNGDIVIADDGSSDDDSEEDSSSDSGGGSDDNDGEEEEDEDEGRDDGQEYDDRETAI